MVQILPWKLILQKITLIPGDGIGQEVVLGTKQIIDSLGLNIQWDIVTTPMDDKTKRISEELEKSLSITKYINKNLFKIKQCY